jgi:hypothetical protein
MISDRSPNGGAPSSRVPPGAGGTAAPQPVPDRAQDAAMEDLYSALGGLRRGAAALTAENHQLRAQIAGLQPAVSSRRSGDAAIQFGELAEIALPTGSGAPGAARKVLDHCFTGLVSQQILTDAELLVSELVTNSVEHGELDSDDTVLVRISSPPSRCEWRSRILVPPASSPSIVRTVRWADAASASSSSSVSPPAGV